MQLKPFQERSLDTLGKFLADVRVTGDLASSYARYAPQERGEPAKYRAISALADVPYVCLRIPTGGGKTIVGAHAISVIAKKWTDAEHPFVLWLVPTETIRAQTADALKNRNHPYRRALEDVFGQSVEVFDSGQIDELRPNVVSTKTCVMVATIQTFRVEDRSIRDAYADKESLESFFTGVSPAGLELKSGTDRQLYSFENLMRLLSPIVIVDEAHNVRTEQSFTTLSRLKPGCILELTATPETRTAAGKTPSNVLVRVHAGELKQAEMVKLPIMLSVQPDGWKQALTASVAQQRRLLALATGEEQYVRPLLLVQAQNTNSEANVAAVKAHLLEEGVAEEAIKIATGEQRELENVDLLSRDTKVDVVITMEALREGWDCSFAYVFCSLRNVTTDTAAEQLLGRVLRMPYASRRNVPELNEAYAYVISNNFAETAQGLRDRLVKDLGFTAEESEQFVQQAPQPGPGLFSRTIEVVRKPNFTGLQTEDARAVRVMQSSDGDWSVELREFVPEPVAERILAEVPAEKREIAKTRVAEHNRAVLSEATAIPDRPPIVVPQLYVRVAGEQLLFTWDLAGEEAPLLASDLPSEVVGFNFSPVDGRFAIDFRAGQMDVRPLSRESLPFYKADWQPTHVALVRWLSREIRTVAISSAQLDAWLNSLLTELEATVPLEALWGTRFAVARRLSEVLDEVQQNVHSRGYQQMLLDSYVPESKEAAFHFLPNRYYPFALYRGLSFERHYYRLVGEMNDPEVECARVLDSLSGVDTWVRNIERDQRNSFKLPKRGSFFYPDFVARLLDGRTLVVEYKGQMRDYEDAEEKKQLGELWESRTAGRGVFAWVESPQVTGRSVEGQIADAITKGD